MNYEYFIAKRIISSKSYKSSVSAPIIKIGTAAIAIGVVVMMIAIATGLGLQKKIRDKMVSFNGHIIISQFSNNQSEESLVPVSTKQDFYPEFNSVEGISHIQGVASKFGVIRTETDFEGVILKGVGGDFNWSYFKDYLLDGELPNFSGKRNEDILISKYLANRLGFKVGDRFNTYFLKQDATKPPSIITYTVKGIFDSGMEELDKTFMLGDIRHIQRLNKWSDDQVGNFEVFIDDYNELQQKGIEVYTNIPSNLDAKTITQKYPTIFEWIGIFDTNIYGIIGIMILVAGINMITALLVLILERTQMIGILKSLGSQNWSVQKVFLYNAMYLILRGLFWGNIIGLVLLFAQKTFNLFPLNPEVYHVSSVPVFIQLWHVVILNIGTFVLCLFMLVLPSYVITKISPVKAMRFE